MKSKATRTNKSQKLELGGKVLPNIVSINRENGNNSKIKSTWISYSQIDKNWHLRLLGEALEFFVNLPKNSIFNELLNNVGCIIKE